MKSIPRFGNQSFWMAVALLAGGLRIAWANSSAEEVVHQAVAICCQAPTGKAVADRPNAWPDFDKLIAGLSKSMLPDLRAIASSETHTKLERRVAQVLCRRIEHPEEFQKVEPFLTPVENPTGRIYGPLASGKRRPSIALKPIDDPELLAPQVRAAIERNGKLYEDLRTEALRIRQRINSLPDGDMPSLNQIYADLDTRIAELKRQYHVEPGQTLELVFACGDPRQRPPMDPKYLPAWEEAVTRASSPEMKANLLQVVRSFRSRDSVPVVAACLSTASKSGDEGILWASLAFLLEVEPTETAVDEISTALDELQGWMRSSAEQQVRSAVSRSPRWQTFLQQMKADPKWSAKADRLLRQTASTTAPGD